VVSFTCCTKLQSVHFLVEIREEWTAEMLSFLSGSGREKCRQDAQETVSRGEECTSMEWRSGVVE
jgi:hypothetical protein